MVWPPFISGRERGAKFRSLPCLLCDGNCLVGKQGRAPPRTGVGRGAAHRTKSQRNYPVFHWLVFSFLCCLFDLGSGQLAILHAHLGAHRIIPSSHKAPDLSVKT